MSKKIMVARTKKGSKSPKVKSPAKGRGRPRKSPASKSKSRSASKSPKKSPRTNCKNKTTAELRKMATERKIQGRSGMSREQLGTALGYKKCGKRVSVSKRDSYKGKPKRQVNSAFQWMRDYKDKHAAEMDKLGLSMTERSVVAGAAYRDGKNMSRKPTKAMAKKRSGSRK